jgi:hypothetical protein
MPFVKPCNTLKAKSMVATGTHISLSSDDTNDEEQSGRWRSAPEPPEPPPPPPSLPQPLFSPEILAGSPVSPERLALGEDWRASLIDQRVADRIAAAASDATSAAAMAVQKAAAAADGTPTATARPVPATPKRDFLDTTGITDGFAGVRYTHLMANCNGSLAERCMCMADLTGS